MNMTEGKIKSAPIETLTARKRRKVGFIWWLLAIILVPVIAIAIFWQELPYRNQLAKQIKSSLNNFGIEAESLKVESVNNDRAIITEIKLGTNKTTTIEKLETDYNIREILRGKLDRIDVDGAEINFYKQDDRWLAGGFEALLKKPSEPEKDAKPLYVNSAELGKILPDSISIKNARIYANDEKLEATLPFELFMKHDEKIELKLAGKDINVISKPYEITTGNLTIEADFDKITEIWKGKIESSEILIAGTPEEIPPLKLTSDLAIAENNISANFSLKDKSAKWNITGEVKLDSNDNSKNLLIFKTLKMPWGGGEISIKSLKLPLAMDKEFSLKININEVEIEKLLGEVSEGKISGSGKISGVIPVKYFPDGRIELDNGTAEGTNEGIISVEPSLIPGDNVQLDFARKMLENFHYTTLKISVSSDKEGRSLINLALEGRNPESGETRPVKLNVNLGGDIIPLLRQSLLPFNDPKQFLQMKEVQ